MAMGKRMVTDRRLTRRGFLAGTGSLLLLGAAGCGGNSGGGSVEGSSDTRTIEHKYGSTEIRGKPERVVSVGFNDQDTLLAFGVKPVGVREWFGEYEYATWPWAQDELGDARPKIVAGFDGINFESVAAAGPASSPGFRRG